MRTKKKEKPDGGWVRGNEVDRRYGISVATRYRWKDEGVIQWTKVNGVVLYNVAKFEEDLNRQAQEQQA